MGHESTGLPEGKEHWDETPPTGSKVEIRGGTIIGPVSGRDVSGEVHYSGETHTTNTETHIGDVGSGNQIVIASQQVNQAMTTGAVALTPEEGAELSSLLTDLKRQLDALDAPAGAKIVGHEMVGQLETELTARDRKPDAITIVSAGKWLLAKLPALAGTVAGLFVNPIVGKIVEAAGELAAGWVKSQFGAPAGSAKPTASGT